MQGESRRVEIVAGDGNDTITVSDAYRATVLGDGGDDLISVSADTRPPYGPSYHDYGSATVEGGDGDDTIDVSAAEGIRVYGDGGDDSITVSGRGYTPFVFVFVDGGEGDDTIDADDGLNGVIGTVLGGDGDDSILGSRPDGGGSGTWVDGGAGNDTIDAADGYVLFASAPNGVTVSLAISGPQDTGNGIDVISNARGINGSDFNDTLMGEIGNDTLDGGDGSDVLSGDEGDDSFLGQGGNDTLMGGIGNDMLDGGDGANRLLGDDGNDSLFGGDQNDVLIGGSGRDRLDGAAGQDRFLFISTNDSSAAPAGRDTIVRFENVGPGVGDSIDLTPIDAQPTTAGNQAFTFIGTAAFGGVEGELRVEASGADSLIQADLTGDGTPDFEILVNNAVADAWVAEDFLL